MTPSDLHLLSEHSLAMSGLLARYKPHFIVAGLCLTAGFGLLALDLTDVEGVTFWAGMIVLFGLPWLVPVLLAYLHGIQQVRVYEEGLAWTARGVAEFHAWEEVREVYRAEKSVNHFWRQTEMTIVFKKLSPIRFEQSLTDFFQLATLVEALATEKLLPHYRLALDQGGAHFGPIVLERSGLRINGQAFRWEEIEEYTIYDAGIVVSPRAYEEYTGEHAAFRDIPNYLILLRLLEELGKHATPSAQSVFLQGRSGNKPA